MLLYVLFKLNVFAIALSLSGRARPERLSSNGDARGRALDASDHGEPDGGEATRKWSPETCRRQGRAAADGRARRVDATGS
jgi:hypothetical protein